MGRGRVEEERVEEGRVEEGRVKGIEALTCQVLIFAVHHRVEIVSGVVQQRELRCVYPRLHCTGVVRLPQRAVQEIALRRGQRCRIHLTAEEARHVPYATDSFGVTFYDTVPCALVNRIQVQKVAGTS
jgi:hypothetical protein